MLLLAYPFPLLYTISLTTAKISYLKDRTGQDRTRSCTTVSTYTTTFNTFCIRDKYQSTLHCGGKRMTCPLCRNMELVKPFVIPHLTSDAQKLTTIILISCDTSHFRYLGHAAANHAQD